MKKILSLLLALGIYLNAQAQKIELSVQSNAGMFHYTGISATDLSMVNYSIPSTDQSYTNNPYGKKYAFSFGAGLKASVVTNSGFLFGLQTDYEEFKSKVILFNYLYTSSSFYPFSAPAGNYDTVGHTYLVSHFINIGPYIGYRFKLKKISIDALPGMDIGLGLNTRERGEVTNRTKLTRKREDPPTDIRLRIGTVVNYDRFSFNASYAKGLTNYMEGMVGGGPYEAKSELFRFGLGYRIL